MKARLMIAGLSWNEDQRNAQNIERVEEARWSKHGAHFVIVHRKKVRPASEIPQHLQQLMSRAEEVACSGMLLPRIPKPALKPYGHHVEKPTVAQLKAQREKH